MKLKFNILALLFMCALILAQMGVSHEGFLPNGSWFGGKITNGGQDVNIQDQNTPAFDLFFTQDVGSPTTLTVDAMADAYSISVTTGHGLVAGDEFVLVDPVSQHGFTGEVVTVAGSNTVNVDRPITFDFLAASTVVQERTSDLNVNGSVTRQTFTVGGSLTAELDVTRFLIQMTTTDAPTLALFGDQAALLRGCQMRRVDGTSFNYWNVKSNSEMSNLMYDLDIYTTAHPQAVNGLAGRMTYAGQNKHGVTLRIGPGEALEFIVQDDLRGLIEFKIIACGHIVEP